MCPASKQRFYWARRAGNFNTLLRPSVWKLANYRRWRRRLPTTWLGSRNTERATGETEATVNAHILTTLGSHLVTELSSKMIRQWQAAPSHISIGELPEGTYLIRIISKEGTITEHKLVRL